MVELVDDIKFPFDNDNTNFMLVLVTKNLQQNTSINFTKNKL